MTMKADGQPTDEDETQLTLEGEVLDGEGAEGEIQGEGTTQGGAAEGEDGDADVVVTIGEDPPPSDEEEVARAPEWVRELRKNHRELQKQNRELQEKLNAASGIEQKPTPLGSKPTLEGCDYDAEKYEQELTGWYERKRQADEQEAKARAEQEAQQKEWQSKLQSYGKAKTELKVKDFDEVEGLVQENFSATQQGIILQGADAPALLVYALGKNPKKAKELSSITDPVKFAFAVAKLETQLKVTNRKAPPPPEKTVQGSGSTSGAVDSNLDRLRAEAEKSGDYSKVIAYKNQQKLKAK